MRGSVYYSGGFRYSVGRLSKGEREGEGGGGNFLGGLGLGDGAGDGEEGGIRGGRGGETAAWMALER